MGHVIQILNLHTLIIIEYASHTLCFTSPGSEAQRDTAIANESEYRSKLESSLSKELTRSKR